MDYEALAPESLTTMSERIRGALRADVVPRRHAPDPPFPVRELLRKKYAANPEAETLLYFEFIDWC